MSYYIHILICWEGGHIISYADPEKIKSIASKYVDRYKSYEIEYDKFLEEESMSTLENISSGKAYFRGGKGCLWISGGIYNYTSGYTVLDELKDFFKELWDNRCFGIGDVVCFYESEQSGEARVLVLDVNKMEIHEVEKEEKWCWGLNW